MSSEMTHEIARLELSARLDSEIDGATALALDHHLESCLECRAYGERLHELRRSLRVRSVEDAPDIAARVMAAVATPSGPVQRRKVFQFRLRIASIAAASTALLLIATVLPLDRTPTGTAQAAEIERAVTSAARSLTSYHARYTITERGWHSRLPERSFAAEVWFEAPESFRLRVRDLTPYPSKAWPHNDVDLVSNPKAQWIREPYACPTEALPGCAAGSGVEQRSVVHRQPFDGSSDAPTDIIVPLESVARSEGLQPVGTETIDGRTAQHVRLTYREAHPLVDALQAGGSWAPIAPLDRVDIWLDAETWFPLRFEVNDENGTVLEVNSESVDEPGSLAPALFRSPREGIVTNGGFIERDAAQIAGYVDLSPTYTAGLKRYRTGLIRNGPTVLSYARGMTWLRLLVDGSTRPDLATQLDSEVVSLGDGGRALYQPADGESERRLDVDDGELHVRLESNLPRGDLMRVAASLPIDGIVADEIHIEGGSLHRLAPSTDAPGFAKRPAFLPDGYRASASFIRSGTQTALIERFTLPEAELRGSGLEILQSPSIDSLPPTSEDLFGVKVGGALARWSQERGQLEWIDDGVYRSITAPSFDLDAVVRIARSMG